MNTECKTKVSFFPLSFSFFFLTNNIFCFKVEHREAIRRALGEEPEDAGVLKSIDDMKKKKKNARKRPQGGSEEDNSDSEEEEAPAEAQEQGEEEVSGEEPRASQRRKITKLVETDSESE